MTVGSNSNGAPKSARTRFDPAWDGRRARLRVRVRTAAVALTSLGLLLAYEATLGPWRRHRDTADSYAKHARMMNDLAAREGRLAEGPGPRAASHRGRARYFSRLADNSAAMEAAYRRLSWLPWSPQPADPPPPDPPPR